MGVVPFAALTFILGMFMSFGMAVVCPRGRKDCWVGREVKSTRHFASFTCSMKARNLGSTWRLPWW